MKKIEAANSAEELLDIKKWYFHENIRILEEKQKLENEKKELEKQKHYLQNELIAKEREIKLQKHYLAWEKELFEKKLSVLERELYRYAHDMERLKEDKKCFEKEKREYDSIKGNQSKTFLGDISDIFFQGVKNQEGLKKRYKDLNKIYHPDNLNGDTRIIQEINRSYNIRKRQYKIP